MRNWLWGQRLKNINDENFISWINSTSLLWVSSALYLQRSIPSIDVIRSDVLTDQILANTSWTFGWPLMNHREGCWFDPHDTVIPELRSPGQLMSVQLVGSDLKILVRHFSTTKMISPINARPKRLQPVPSEAFAGLHLSLSEDRGDHGPALSLQLLLPLTLTVHGDSLSRIENKLVLGSTHR